MCALWNIANSAYEYNAFYDNSHYIKPITNTKKINYTKVFL